MGQIFGEAKTGAFFFPFTTTLIEIHIKSGAVAIQCAERNPEMALIE
jgi:hypothetical protein